VLPQGSAVFGAVLPSAAPRFMAAAGSGIASVVIIGGAAWSAVRLWRSRRSAARVVGDVRPGRLAVANVLIAVGTIVLGSGGVLNSVADAMDAFALSLVFGIALIFTGFLLTNTPPPLAPVEPWHLPDDVRRQRPERRSADAEHLVGDPDADDDTDEPATIDLARPRPGSPSLN
jgi:hypothetical protein